MSSSTRKSGRKSGKGSSHKPETRDENLQVYLAVYTPSDGHYYHWAIAVFNETTTLWHTYEVVRNQANGSFMKNSLAVDPRNSNRCLPLIYLTSPTASSAANVLRTITRVSVQPQPEWDCQSYVIDVVDALQTENLTSRAEWEAAWNDARPFHGYIEQAFGGVRSAPEDDQRILSEEYVHDSDDDE